MRTRQVAIPMTDLAAMGSGFFLKQYLRGQGLNPDGKIIGTRAKKDEVEYMVYTEQIEDKPEPLIVIAETE